MRAKKCYDFPLRQTLETASLRAREKERERERESEKDEKKGLFACDCHCGWTGR